jgi:hypothetical protein
MDPIASKLTTSLPQSPSPETTSTPSDKVGASKFDKIRNQLNDKTDSQVSATQSASPVNPSAQVNNPGVDKLNSKTAPVSGPDRLRQSLTTSQYHLDRLKNRVASSPEISSMQGIMNRLTSAESQYQHVDAAVRSMPANANPQQLISLQQMVYSMNENISGISKVIDQAVSGVKSVLSTQI